jgi:phosphatidylserine synthase
MTYLAIFVSLLFVFMGIVRLASYSREGFKLKYFRGLPTPSATLIVISSILIVGGGSTLNLPYFGIFAAFVVSILMVSPFPYPKPRQVLAALSAIILLMFMGILLISSIYGYAAVLYGSFLLLIGMSAYAIAGPFYCRMVCPPKTI